jgi:hypothetical protein
LSTTPVRWLRGVSRSAEQASTTGNSQQHHGRQRSPTTARCSSEARLR